MKIAATRSDKAQDLPKELFIFDPIEAARLLSLLANPVRIDVLRRILEREWDVSALAIDLEITQSSLSQHLAKLRGGGLVQTRHAAQRVLYSSASEEVRAVFEALDAFGTMPTGKTSEGQMAKRLPRSRKPAIR